VRRFDCLREASALLDGELVVTNNGGASTEWAAVGRADSHLQVKTLGLCSSIGLGLALALPHRRVIVFDGDGSLLMNLSTLPTIAGQRPPNLIHVVFDNRIYEASGGTETQTAPDRAGVDLAAMARAAGLANVHAVDELAPFVERFGNALTTVGPTFLHARVEPVREKVPPVAVDEVENKYRLVRYIERTEGIAILARPQPASQAERA
jgi:thiamine pyrophosphate-dependent acetolactate synthase large subunit-like protein